MKLKQFAGRTRRSALCAVMCASVVASCGGGGGGSQSPSPSGPPSSSPPPTTTARQFSNITNDTGIRFVHRVVNSTGSKAEAFGGGVAVGDYDRDGDLDLYVVRGDIGPNLLYRNDGGNRFTDVAAAAGVDRARSGGGGYLQSGPVFADIDGDGHLDLFIGGLEGDPSVVYRNRGDGTYEDVTSASGLGSMSAINTISASFADYDLDGDLDLALAHWGTPRPPDGLGGHGDTETLWRNDSDTQGIRFTNVSVESGIAATLIAGRGGYNEFRPNQLDYDYTFVPLFARLDEDRYPDLVLVADFRNTRQFMNNGAQQGSVSFRDATDNSVIIDENGMGAAAGDVDNDGDLDWFVTSIFSANQTIGNRLYRNDGTGRMQDVTLTAGVANGSWGWGACFADFNLDGRLDIFHTNGWTSNPIDDFEHDSSRLFIAQTNGTFSNDAGARGMTDAEQGRSVVCADFDADGDVDIFMTNRGRENSGAFWLNNDTSNTNKSLTVRLIGAAPNTHAAGARVSVTVGGLTQMREVAVGNNFTSQVPTPQIFGLGAATTVDSVRIEWPDGHSETHANVPAGVVTWRE